MSRRPEVYIIESRSAEDHWEDRHEGRTLRHVLEMEGVQSKLREVVQLPQLRRALREASRGCYSYVHLSCHGGADGIELTDGTHVTWDLFDELAWPGLRGKCVVFSSCEVGAGVGRLFELHRTFCNAVVAPRGDITWSESIAAFTAFYHLATSADTAPEDDIRMMNQLVGRPVFCVSRGSGRAGDTYVLGAA